jgi:two-component system chemotaxis response regulator CheB
MPPTFTTLLAARLTATSEMTIREPEAGEVVEPGMVYLAPGGQHMALVKEGAKLVIQLNTDPPENSCRPAVDVLFRSAARIYGKDLLGVILTGMGQDGLKGCEQIKAKQGQVIAQDEASSVIWGMPMAVVKNNLADAVLPLDKVMDEIIFRTRKV